MDDKPCKYFHDTVSSCIIHICEILLLCPWFALMLVAVAIAKFEVKMIWASVFRDNPRPSPWASSSKDHRVNDPPGKRSHIPNPRRFSLSIGGMFQQIIDFQQQWKGLVNFHGELEDVWGPNPCSSNGNTCTKRKGDIADLSEWRHNVEGNGISTPPETYGRLLSHPQFPCVLKIKLQKLWTQHGIQSIFCTIKYMKIWNIEYKYIMYNIYHSSWQLSIIAKKKHLFFLATSRAGWSFQVPRRLVCLSTSTASPGNWMPARWRESPTAQKNLVVGQGIYERCVFCLILDVFGKFKL